MISHEVLKWKLEMYMAVKNIQYLFILNPNTLPYLFWVWEGKKQIPPHVLSHHPKMSQAIKLKLYDFKDTS